MLFNEFELKCSKTQCFSTIFPTTLAVGGSPYLAALSTQHGNVEFSLFQAALENGSGIIVYTPPFTTPQYIIACIG